MSMTPELAASIREVCLHRSHQFPAVVRDIPFNARMPMFRFVDFRSVRPRGRRIAHGNSPISGFIVDMVAELRRSAALFGTVLEMQHPEPCPAGLGPYTTDYNVRMKPFKESSHGEG